jgi:transcriptional regulator with XRE-family HTH domain
MALGNNVKALRLARGWSMPELGQRAGGIDAKAIDRLEKRNSQRSTFAGQLARAFGLTIEQLMYGEPDDLLSTPHAQRPPVLQLTDQEIELIGAFRDVRDDYKREILNDLLALAASERSLVTEILAKYGAKGPPHPAHSLPPAPQVLVAHRALPSLSKLTPLRKTTKKERG